MQLLRCLNMNCSRDPHGRPQFDFVLEDTAPPICPECQTDMRQRPDFVIKRKLMHYDPPHPKLANRGQGKAACGQGGWTPNAGIGYTGDPGAVNCPRCRETEAWKTNAVESGVAEKFDFPIEIDPKNMTITKVEPCSSC